MNAAWIALLLLATGLAEGYRVGLGIGDTTGPASDSILMGYGKPMVTARGLHTRLYARVFLFAEDAADGARVAIVVVDACTPSQLATTKVVEKLQERYGSLYNRSNVAITATHTHASAAGVLQHWLYNIPSGGFVPDSFHALVDGIVESIAAAHDNLQPARVGISSGELLGASVNRSPTSYAHNPEAERALYEHDVDKNMTLLSIQDAASRPLGALSWFAVHCTSMNNTNRLLSGDNKGAASLFVEEWFRRHPTGPAPNFTAAFAQSNMGDVSPNVGGARCLDTGLPCDPETSTCNGDNQRCHARGPGGTDIFESTRAIGQLQADKALQLWHSAQTELSGPIDFRHRLVNMSSIEVQQSRWTRAGHTCPPAMGVSFAAGTTDGPGGHGFRQSDSHLPGVWRLLVPLLPLQPDEQLRACHAPKPILLNTGKASWPYAWQPAVVDVSILRLGQLLILCLPGEPTTMAGRRLRAAVADTVREAWGEVQVVVASLTGTYSSYITTWEEYQAQRYEGGSTLYGPHTLDAYIQELVAMARAMVDGQAVDPGVPPPNLLQQQVSLLPPVILDFVPPGSHFGQVVTDAEPEYQPGDSVVVVFRAGCPRNNLRRNGTFLAVERLDPDSGAWGAVHSDRDWCTRFHWRRHMKLSPLSYATLQWDIPADTPAGTYRLHYFGDAKRAPWSKPAAFEGVSRPFLLRSTPAADQQCPSA